MNKYQRDLIAAYPNIGDVRFCCYEEAEDIPKEMVEAAQNGDLEKIKDFLIRGFNVNAQFEGEVLLSRACAAGQCEVVKLLLCRKDIHLNKLYKSHTPLERAAQNGHLECIKVLLNADTECRLHLKLGWRGIVGALKLKPHLRPDAAIWIFNWAANQCQWEAVHLLLHSDYFFPEQSLYLAVLQALHVDNWEVVLAVLRRQFPNKEKVMNEVLGIVVTLRQWERIREVLQMKELDLDQSLAEAALEGDTEKVQRLLNEEKYDAKVLNGCLLVVAAGGTSEPTAQCLAAVRNTYTQRTFADALFLTSVASHSELFSHLLCNPEADYSFPDLSRPYHIMQCVIDQNDLHGLDFHYQSMLSCLNGFIKAKIELMTI